MGRTMLVLSLISSWLLLASAVEAEDEAQLLARAKAIHERAIVVDSHVDIPPDFATAAYDPMAANAPRQKIDLPGMELGGLRRRLFCRLRAAAGAQPGELRPRSG